MKDKQFMASTLFIKKPERLEAILMIMALCLLVYASLERELRQQLQKQQQTVPNQVKKQVQNPTMRWIFAIFTGIHCLYMKDERKFVILNLNDLHLKILNLLGNTTLKYYKLE
jgi:transposase